MIAGTAASKPNQHRDKAAAGQPDFSQQFVHDKSNTGHIAAVLQNGQKEEQHHDDR